VGRVGIGVVEDLPDPGRRTATRRDAVHPGHPAEAVEVVAQPAAVGADLDRQPIGGVADIGADAGVPVADPDGFPGPGVHPARQFGAAGVAQHRNPAVGAEIVTMDGRRAVADLFLHCDQPATGIEALDPGRRVGGPALVVGDGERFPIDGEPGRSRAGDLDDQAASVVAGAGG
jgi:hypothetical protein